MTITPEIIDERQKILNKIMLGTIKKFLKIEHYFFLIQKFFKSHSFIHKLDQKYFSILQKFDRG